MLAQFLDINGAFNFLIPILSPNGIIMTENDYIVKDIYAPNWQFAVRILMPIIGILYILSISDLQLIISKKFIYIFCIFHLCFHIYLRNRMNRYGFVRQFVISASFLDIIGGHFAWLVDPYDPPAMFLLLLMGVIGNNLQHGLKNYKILYYCSFILAPSVYITRIIILGFNPAAFYMMIFSCCMLFYIFLLVSHIELLKTHIKNWSSDLEHANDRLKNEIKERKRVESSLRESEITLKRYKEKLEERVKERTLEIAKTNQKLIEEIAEHQATEVQLKTSEEKYRRLFKNVTDYVYVFDFEGNVLETNINFKKDFLDKLGDIQSKKIPDAIAPKYKQLFYEDMEKVKAYSSSQGLVTIELKNKSKMVFEYKNTLIQDSNGNDAVQGVARDITKRVYAEKRLQYIHQQLLDIIERLPDAVFVIDQDKRVIYWNKAIEEMTGVKKDEIIGKGDYEYAIPFYGIRRPIICDLLWQVNTEIESQYDFIEKDQNTIYAEVFVPSLSNGKGAYIWAKASALLNKDHQINGAIQSIRDISKQKADEEKSKQQQEQLFQADRMATLGTLVAGVAHEINNPITSIMLNAPVLDDLWNRVLPVLDQYYQNHDNCEPGGMSYSMIRERVPLLLSAISEGADRVSNIVAELKDFARERPPDMTDQIDLNEVGKTATGLVLNLIRKSTEQFSETYESDLPRFKGNKQRIEQVVINLLVNACQALTSKKQAISIKTGCNHSANSIFIEIYDEGSGISQEVLQRIKDPFFTTKRNSGGTGLGLAISDKIIQAHGGSLIFSSTPGEKTIARLEIPIPETQSDEY